MKILGISAFYHDSAAALIIDGQVVAAAQEERFTRKKHDSSFPVNAIKFCLNYSKLSLDSLDAVVYYEKPFLKFERLLETYYAFAPKGVVSFATAIPAWLKEKLFVKYTIKKSLAECGTYNKKKLNLLFTEHHQSHAASAFYPSEFENSAILTIDGVGEWTTASIAQGNAEGIRILREMHFPHSLGLLYSAFTYFLGFVVNSGEYKLMGLAPYGNPEDTQTLNYIKQIKEHIVNINTDGSIKLNMKYFRFHTGLRMINHSKWKALFGFSRRKPNDEVLQHHCNLAYAIQSVSEEIILNMAKEAKRLTGSNNLCLAGGVSLNCVANGKLLNSGLFDNLYIQPAAGDAGGAVGSALETWHLLQDKNSKNIMPTAFLGPEFSNDSSLKMLQKYNTVFEELDFDELNKRVAKLIDNGNVIGWFQGRMEYGPRALGNRSIIADPRNPEMQKKLNLKIKFREGFRPFAPTVLAEYTKEYFDINNESPYMLLVADVNNKYRYNVPDNYYGLNYMEKLYTKRSQIQAITHVDFSARLQTVSKTQNESYYNLINTFYKLTGCPIIINTSFNVRGEPIVCTPEEAYRCFMRTEMDYLIIGNLFFNKNNQPKNLKFTDKFKAD
jgi:carbamoyltransferase